MGTGIRLPRCSPVSRGALAWPCPVPAVRSAADNAYLLTRAPKFICLCLVVSRESARIVLKLHGRFRQQSGKISKLINVIPRILIPPFGGSNPPAPASV
jgi:hypothetical protein